MESAINITLSFYSVAGLSIILAGYGDGVRNTPFGKFYLSLTGNLSGFLGNQRFHLYLSGFI